jgi:hypothetical protein
MAVGLRRGGLVCLARLCLLLPRDPTIAVLSLVLKEILGIFLGKAKVGPFPFLLAGAEKDPGLFASLLTRSPSPLQPCSPAKQLYLSLMSLINEIQLIHDTLFLNCILFRPIQPSSCSRPVNPRPT